MLSAIESIQVFEGKIEGTEGPFGDLSLHSRLRRRKGLRRRERRQFNYGRGRGNTDDASLDEEEEGGTQRSFGEKEVEHSGSDG
jgi:hypothetical protein